MKYLYLFFILFMASLSALKAQEEYKVYANDTILGGNLSMSLDAEVEQLLNKKVASNCAKLSRRIIVEPIRPNRNNTRTTTPSSSDNTPTTRNRPTVRRKPADPCAASPKVLGYKIQIFHSNSRSVAEAKLKEVRKKYSYLSPEMAYSKPTYRILLGNYFTKRSASVDLSRVKKSYSGAFLVQWRVWCRRAK